MMSKWTKRGLWAVILTAAWIATPDAQAQYRGGSWGGGGNNWGRSNNVSPGREFVVNFQQTRPVP